MSKDDDLQPYRDILKKNNGDFESDVEKMLEGVEIKNKFHAYRIAASIRQMMVYARIPERKKRAYRRVLLHLDKMAKGVDPRIKDLSDDL